MATASSGRPEVLGDWASVLKRTFKQFLADDCMGLAQQVAYSALLAFFPTVIFLVGLLALIGAYDALRDFLDPVAPQAVTDVIEQLKEDSGGGASVAAIVLGAFGAIWAASGAMAETRRWRNLYRDRAAVAREFGRLKNEYGLTPQSRASLGSHAGLLARFLVPQFPHLAHLRCRHCAQS